jgi:hypothetical protein
METLIDVNELARVLRRSPATIKRDLRRNPAAVPPRTTLPGTRLLRWRAVDVQRWLSTHSGAAGAREAR